MKKKSVTIDRIECPLIRMHTPAMAEEESVVKKKEQEHDDVESQIQTAMTSRVAYFKEQSE